MDVVRQFIRLHRRDVLLNTMDTRDWRPHIFLAVLVFHLALVLLVVRTARLPISISMTMNEPLLLLFLPHADRAAENTSTPPRGAHPRRLVTSKPRVSRPEAETSNPAVVVPAVPKTDWEKEAELSTQNAIAKAAKENGYRNLSALSPEQLRWLRQNRLEPVAPGMLWTYRRVEVTEGGFPIIHINDHCVAIPFLMMMVFCKIGNIESRGDLFEHMRDPHNP
jgi:hypothetical protein